MGERISNPVTRLLGFFSILGLPSYVSLPVSLLFIYFSWLLFINVFFDAPFPSLSNIFFLRDLLLIVVFSPIYAIYSERLLSLPKNLVGYFVDEEMIFEVLGSSLRRIFGWRENILVGLVYPVYYVWLTTNYLLSGYYRFEFYMYRLVAVFGLFVVGAVIYQTVMIIKMFVRDLSVLVPNERAYLEGIPAISEVALLGSALLIGGISVNFLPTLLLGYNPRSTLWYLTSHLVLYVVAFVYFLTTIFGVHRGMLSAKRLALSILVDFLNRRDVSVGELRKSPLSDKRLTADDAPMYLNLFENARTWPVRFIDVLKLVLMFLSVSILWLLLIYF